MMEGSERNVKVQIRRLRQSAAPIPIPEYRTAGAAGLDLCADVEMPTTLRPLERMLIPTGFALQLPDGYEGQVRPRSGLAAIHGVTCLNAPGTVDSDYRGEVKVLLINLSDQAFTLQRGDRIAQLVIAPVARVVLTEVTEMSETARGEGGFGSTGR